MILYHGSNVEVREPLIINTTEYSGEKSITCPV